MGAFVEMENMTSSTSNGHTKSKDVESNNTSSSPGKVSMFQAATHLFKGSVGAGLFAMGDCFKNGGLIGSVIGLPVIAVIVVHCELLLINCSVLAVEKTPGAIFYDYPDTVQKCFEYGPKRFQRFSKVMKLVVEIFLTVTQFGFCAVFFVFITKNLHQVLLQHGIQFSETTVALLTLLPALIPSLMTNLKHIAPVSLLASFSMIFGVFATLTIALKGSPLPPISERKLITNIPQTALFFGTAQFAFEGIALILPLRNSMKDPKKFVSRFGVLNVTIFFITILFIITGSISYLRWGNDIQGIITLNLDPRNVFSQAVKIIAASGVYFGIPIQFMVLVKTVWPRIVNSSIYVEKHPITFEVIFRFILLLMTFGAALIVPKLGLFISLIGALCSTSLAIVIPVVIDFVTKSQMTKGLNAYIYIKNATILVVGLLGIVVGTYQSIIDIVASFH